jgi:hypothetical protein
MEGLGRRCEDLGLIASHREDEKEVVVVPS